MINLPDRSPSIASVHQGQWPWLWRLSPPLTTRSLAELNKNCVNSRWQFWLRLFDDSRYVSKDEIKISHPLNDFVRFLIEPNGCTRPFRFGIHGTACFSKCSKPVAYSPNCFPTLAPWLFDFQKIITRLSQSAFSWNKANIDISGEQWLRCRPFRSGLDLSKMRQGDFRINTYSNTWVTSHHYNIRSTSRTW